MKGTKGWQRVPKGFTLQEKKGKGSVLVKLPRVLNPFGLAIKGTEV